LNFYTGAAGRLLTGGEASIVTGVITNLLDGSNMELSTGTSSTYVSGITMSALSASGAPGTVRLWTSGAERFRITANGNVGIGTTSPAYKLDVAGDARISGKSYYKAEYSVGVGAYVAINLNAAGNTILAAGNTYRVELAIRATGTSTGAVYIITQNDAVWVAKPVNITTGASNYPQLRIDPTNSNKIEIFHSHPLAPYNIVTFVTATTTDNTVRTSPNFFGLDAAFTIINEGTNNILAGLGTNTPENADGWQRVFDLNGPSHSKIITTTSAVQTGIFSHNTGVYGAPAGGVAGTATNHAFSFVTNKLSRMTIATNGNVGIGTGATGTIPNLLTVNGNASMTSAIISANILLSSTSPLIMGTQSGILRVIGGTTAATDPSITLYGSTHSANPKLITLDGEEIRFRLVNGTTESMRVTSGGNVAIGVDCVPSGYKLAVKGNIICEKLKVKPYASCATWADYVFESDYKLLKLNEVEAFIKKNKHLPGVPSAAEVDANGVEVVEMEATLLKKIEELTLYVIELQKQVDELKKK
jgi:hypothetical protein